MKIPFIPKYIKQVIDDSPRKIVTAERWNELLNLLITQGDYNAEAIKTMLDRISINGEEGVLLTLTAADINAVGTTGDETIAGVKTFDSFPISPSSAPTTDYQFANKKYVDDNASYSKANLLKDTTAALYGLDSEAVPDEVFRAANNIMTKNLINILRLKLQQSLKANDIDAWSDLLADSSGIDTVRSSKYTLGDKKLYKADAGWSTIAQASPYHGPSYFGTPESPKVGQVFVTESAEIISLTRITGYLIATGGPQDGVVCQIYSVLNNKPSELLFTSDNIAVYSQIPNSSPSPPIQFNFTDTYLMSDTKYAIVFARTGELGETGRYAAYYATSNLYAGGKLCENVGGEWVVNTSQALLFSASLKHYYNEAIVIWNSVSATEPLSAVAIVAEQDEKLGSVTWYLSDDGETWEEIEDVNRMQSVSFDIANVYLKCVLTGDAEVSAVAWGGY